VYHYVPLSPHRSCHQVPRSARGPVAARGWDLNDPTIDYKLSNNISIANRRWIVGDETGNHDRLSAEARLAAADRRRVWGSRTGVPVPRVGAVVPPRGGMAAALWFTLSDMASSSARRLSVIIWSHYTPTSHLGGWRRGERLNVWTAVPGARTTAWREGRDSPAAARYRRRTSGRDCRRDVQLTHSSSTRRCLGVCITAHETAPYRHKHRYCFHQPGTP